MKKFLAIFMVAIMCFSFCSCSGGPIMTIDELEMSLQKYDDDLEFSVSESGFGYEFTYEDYSGTADSQQNINTLTYSYDDLDFDVLTDSSLLTELRIKALTDSGSMTFGEIPSFSFDTAIMTLYDIFSDENNEEALSPTDAADLYSGQTLNVNGWTFSATTDYSDNSCEVTIKR